MEKKNIRFIVKILLVFLVILFLCISVSYSKADYVDVTNYASADVVYANGKTLHSNTNVVTLLNKDDKATFHIKLPKNKKIKTSVLCFLVYHTTVNAYFEGKRVYSAGEDIDATGSMIGAINVNMDIPEEAWGKTIDIVLDSRENNSIYRVKEFLVYPAQNAYEYYAIRHFFELVVVVISFIIAVVFVILLFFRGTQVFINRGGALISLFALLLSIWITTSCGLQNLFSNSHWWTWAEYLSLYMLCLPLLCYFTIPWKETKHKKLLLSAIIVNIIFDITATILNFTDICHYCDILTVGHLVIIMSATAMLIELVGKFRNKSKGSELLMSGVAIMMACGLVDVLKFNLEKYLLIVRSLPLPSIISLGMSIFLITLIGAYLDNVESEKIKVLRVEKDLEERNQLISYIPVCICVFGRDEEHRLLEANDTFYDTIGYTKEELKKLKIDKLDGFITEGNGAAVEKSIQSESDIDDSKYEVEFSMNTKSGKTINFLGRFYDIPEEDYIICSLTDITMRTNMAVRMNLIQKEGQIAVSLSDSQIMIYNIDEDAIYHKFHTVDFLGTPWKLENMRERVAASYMFNDVERANALTFLDSIRAGLPHGTIELRLRSTRESNFCWYKVSFYSIFDDNGRVVEAVIAIQDISARKEKEVTAKTIRANCTSGDPEEHGYLEFDITKEQCIYKWGNWFEGRLTDENEELTWDKTLLLLASDFVYPDDKGLILKMLRKEKLIEAYHRGQKNLEIDYRYVDREIVWAHLNVEIMSKAVTNEIIVFCDTKKISSQESELAEMKMSLMEMESQVEKERARLIVSQMRPHFLYNALSSIRAIIKINPEYAYNLMYDFSVHLRASVRAMSSDDPITFEEELANIKAYMNIEQMRQRDRLKVVYDIQSTDFLVIPLSVQPLVENAAKHGVYQRGKTGGTVTLKTYETDSTYIIKVIDDGIGFDYEETMKHTENSFGLKNLTYRWNSLMHGQIDIKSKIGVGTEVTVSIPKDVNEE